ncbi:3-dehydroquinate synthase [Tautonia plasticadhaerens]|uniref:3-dehydroquinate synthase n=1 Tax=Tautonia plasticadhaerens TaxID=2527974 RepID=A0A518HBT7_9BACT|nr:3-dehydroquinate synthase [Tautonia plasticadhaerens]QDV38322.1 3-dehydroquinate synthase [Tautonia plasticadhaerens]
MTNPSDPLDRLDQPFSAPFVHRLRFTRDVLGADSETLAELLEPSGDRPARVQFWVDGHVLDARPGLLADLRAFTERLSGRIRPVGDPVVVPGGEAIKNDTQGLEGMLRSFNEADLDRRSYVVVVGGGAVLDAVGFAAAIAHRGIRLVRLPTTTLAQADSGVGVKNAVNLFGKKNWLGAFAVPWAVVNDEALLETLPDRDYVSGFSEAVKVSLLKDPIAFDRIARTARRIARRDPEAVRPVIRDSVRMHLDHITRGGDPFEALEARPLDFGHWSAHKLEPLSGFALRHGEAVAIGVAIDTVYSSLVLGLDPGVADRVVRCLADLNLPLDDPSLDDTDHLFLGLEEFRQHLGGRLTLTMVPAVGRPVEVHEVDYEAMTRAIARVRTLARRLGTPRVPRLDPPPHPGGCARPSEEARLGLDRPGSVLWSGR